MKTGNEATADVIAAFYGFMIKAPKVCFVYAVML